LNYDTPESDCVNVDATAQKWSFSFQYPNGATAPNLYLLVNQDVKINMTSKDVLHALYLPVFRTQRNFIPYRQTYIWFKPTELSPRESADPNDPGGWPIYCTQYCGNGHSRMFARVYVLTKPEFDAKMNELANPFKKKQPDGTVRYRPYFEVGEQLYHEIGCVSCHNTTGAPGGTGPTWKGLWKRDHEFSYVDPKSVGVDASGQYSLKAADPDGKWDDYLKESELYPDAKLVRFEGKDYHGMPSFYSQFTGSEVNIEKQRAIAEFIKSLNPDYKKPDPTSDPYDATKHPDHHPESLAAKMPQSQPATVP
jgi:cytochrome c oxidase subunit 2